MHFHVNLCVLLRRAQACQLMLTAHTMHSQSISIGMKCKFIFVKKYKITYVGRKNRLLLFVYMSKISANHWAVSVIIRNKNLSIERAINATKTERQRECQVILFLYLAEKSIVRKNKKRRTMECCSFQSLRESRQCDTYALVSINLEKLLMLRTWKSIRLIAHHSQPIAQQSLQLHSFSNAIASLRIVIVIAIVIAIVIQRINVNGQLNDDKKYAFIFELKKAHTHTHTLTIHV